MKKIGSTIIEEAIHKLEYDKKRTTARIIIFNEKRELLMLYSKKFNDYTFPGGGIKEDEDIIEGLKREVKEETGIILQTIKPYGYCVELRYGINGNITVYEQTSYYFIGTIEWIGKPNYIEREALQGLSIVYVDMEKAYKHNEQVIKDETHQVKGLKTVLLRENMVIESLMKDMK